MKWGLSRDLGPTAVDEMSNKKLRNVRYGPMVRCFVPLRWQ